VRNRIRHADDTVVFAASLEDLQEIMTIITQTSEQYNIDLNISKTKFMGISESYRKNSNRSAADWKNYR